MPCSLYLNSMPNIVSKYVPPLNVQHIPSSVGKKEKYSIQGLENPNQVQSMTISVQAGAACLNEFTGITLNTKIDIG